MAEIAGLRQLLQTTEEDPLASPLMRSRLQELEAKLSKLQTQPSLTPEAEIFFTDGPAIGSEAIEVTFASEVLNSYQNMVTNHFTATHYGGVKRTGRRRGESEAKLYLTALPRGSFGMQLSQPHVADFYLAENVSKAMLNISELIRDTALQVAGILNLEVGGKSVMPFLPKGVGELAYGGSKWKETFGKEAYRRGLYIHYQRTTPYPLLVNFDAPDSNVACSRRRPSNGPLQALNLLNDPVFIEASNAFADRSAAMSTATGERLAGMFTLALGRPPTETERGALARYLDKQTDVLRSEGKSGELLTQAAWSGVARVLFNLDEFINRE